MAVDHVARGLAGHELRHRRDQDRVAHLGPHPRDLLEHAIEQLGPAQLLEHPPGGGDHPAGQLVAVVGAVELARLTGGQVLGAGELVEVRGHCRLRLEVERVGVPGGLEVADRVEHLRLGRPARQRARRRVHDLKPGIDALDVDQRRQPDRAVAVQLDRPSCSGGEQVRRQLAHRGRGQQPAGVLQVQAVHVGAVGQRGRPLGVVVVGVDRADRVREPDHDLLDPLLARHPGQPSEPRRVVGRVGDLKAADPVAGHQPERQPDHVLVGGHPRDEPHPGADHPQRRVRHRRAHQPDPLPRVLAMEAHRHRHVRARREVERVVADPVHRRGDRDHVGRGQPGGAPQALVAVAGGRVDELDHARRGAHGWPSTSGPGP